jgi:hypothetical protein
MGAIFPMAPLAVRQGLIKKREKEARRAAEAQKQASVQAAAGGALAQRLPPVADKPGRSRLERQNCRRKGEAKRKAKARRVNEDMAVSGAVKDLLEAHRESVAAINWIPKDELGRMRAYDLTQDGEEVISFKKPSCVFKRFTADERHALWVITWKYRAAAKRLEASVANAWGVWQTTLAEYKRTERMRSATKPGGQL